MSYVIPIGGWVNLSGGGEGCPLKFQGVVKKRESPDSPEVGISLIVQKKGKSKA